MSNWWANKLGNPGMASTPPVSPPGRVPYVPTPGADYHRQQVQYDADQDSLVASAQKASATRQAAPGTCPECGGKNYVKVGVQATQTGSFEVRRCYDCGYPLVQSGSGATGRSDGPALPAQQLSTTNNFNPGMIVGRIEG